MRRSGTTFVALLLAGAATSAMAQTYQPGPYLGLGAGVTILEDQKETGVNTTLSARTHPDTGFNTLLFGGYSFGWWRLEGEMGYRRASIKNTTVNSDGGLSVLQGLPAIAPGTTPAGSGFSDAKSLMGNIIFDLPWGFAGITPYLGVGVGPAFLSTHVRAGGTNITNDSDIRVAYQGIAGLSWNFNPSWSVSADYRYFGTADPTYSDAAGRKLKSEFSTHNGVFAVTYHFGAPKPLPPQPPAPVVAPTPPPPPQPAPTVQRAQPFLVFFDFDRSDITVEADRVIRTAADTWKRGGNASLVATGHTDRSGSDAYNQALSVRRANAVKARLVQYGVPAGSIETVGKGESEPLVPTADGVREPQNRRVEILFRQ